MSDMDRINWLQQELGEANRIITEKTHDIEDNEEEISALRAELERKNNASQVRSDSAHLWSDGYYRTTPEPEHETKVTYLRAEIERKDTLLKNILEAKYEEEIYGSIEYARKALSAEEDSDE